MITNEFNILEIANYVIKYNYEITKKPLNEVSLQHIIFFLDLYYKKIIINIYLVISITPIFVIME